MRFEPATSASAIWCATNPLWAITPLSKLHFSNFYLVICIFCFLWQGQFFVSFFPLSQAQAQAQACLSFPGPKVIRLKVVGFTCQGKIDGSARTFTLNHTQNHSTIFPVQHIQYCVHSVQLWKTVMQTCIYCTVFTILHTVHKEFFI